MLKLPLPDAFVPAHAEIRALRDDWFGRAGVCPLVVVVVQRSWAQQPMMRPAIR